jgi:hypothetical protein
MNLKVTAKVVGVTSRVLEKILAKQKCKTFIGWRAVEKDRKDKLDFNYKIYKIKRVIDDFIPDDRTKELEAKQVAVALTAISESNKMQGHYSAEKVLTANVNMDADLEQAKQVMLDLIEKNKKEY